MRQSDLVRKSPPAPLANMRSMSRGWRPLSFYLGVPLLFSLYAAANNWQLIDKLGGPVTLLFYLAHALVPWLVTGTLSYLAMQVLRPWQPRPWVIMTIGSITACLLTIPYVQWLSHDLAWFGAVREDAELTDPWRIMVYMTRATVVWLAVNFVFDRFLGLPRYRYTLAVTAVVPARTLDATPAAKPLFMQRMARPATLDELIALKAEQHYIQVITDRGSELVLYRLSDAVRELPLDFGVQVHRSWWVSRGAARSIRTSGKKVTVALRNGLEVPVSTPYQALARSVVAQD